MPCKGSAHDLAGHFLISARRHSPSRVVRVRHRRHTFEQTTEFMISGAPCRHDITWPHRQPHRVMALRRLRSAVPHSPPRRRAPRRHAPEADEVAVRVQQLGVQALQSAHRRSRRGAGPALICRSAVLLSDPEPRARRVVADPGHRQHVAALGAASALEATQAPVESSGASVRRSVGVLDAPRARSCLAR